MEAPTHTSLTFKQLRVWVPLLAVFLGVLYQTTFWTSFGVRPLMYLGLQDIARISFGPLLGVSFVMFFVVVGNSIEERLGDPAKLVPEWIRGNLSRGTKRVLYAVGGLTLISGASGLAWLALQELSIGQFLAVIIGVLVVAGLSASSLLPALRPNVRKAVMIVFGLSPFMALLFADQAVDAIESGSEYTAATIKIEGYDSIDLQIPTSGLKYLGHLNGFEFFRKGKETYVVESHRIVHLKLEKASEKAGSLKP